MDSSIRKAVLTAQRNEITEHFIYLRLSEKTKDPRNAEVLRNIAEQELAHAEFWKSKTNMNIKPRKFRIMITVFLARLLGLTFMLKLMESREGTGSKLYSDLSVVFPEAGKLSEEEREHERSILKMLDEEMLTYIGSIVLGLNDAIVELTGALAGFTLALGDTKLISLVGLVTGISAAMSMAASDYLSTKAEGDPRAARSALYTGVSYILTVLLLILPFLLMSDRFAALAVTLSIAVLIIFFFNYYISVTKELNFTHRFLEMTTISLGVASFSFLIGYILRSVFNVEV
ncbi:MAG TPA: VIT1/CCC1 family protein [Bacteroidales bacterium]|nr:VIT1/CCC1 family protein [Bacteroidales bacterium]